MTLFSTTQIDDLIKPDICVYTLSKEKSIYLTITFTKAQFSGTIPWENLSS
jgi:hypothetical protein